MIFAMLFFSLIRAVHPHLSNFVFIILVASGRSRYRPYHHPRASKEQLMSSTEVLTTLAYLSPTIPCPNPASSANAPPALSETTMEYRQSDTLLFSTAPRSDSSLHFARDPNDCYRLIRPHEELPFYCQPSLIDQDLLDDMPRGFPYEDIWGVMWFMWEYLNGMQRLVLGWLELRWEVRGTT